MTPSQALAHRLTELRRQSKLTASEVCDRTGIGLGTLADLEDGECQFPQSMDLRTLARVYGGDNAQDVQELYIELMVLAGHLIPRKEGN